MRTAISKVSFGAAAGAERLSFACLLLLDSGQNWPP